MSDSQKRLLWAFRDSLQALGLHTKEMYGGYHVRVRPFDLETLRLRASYSYVSSRNNEDCYESVLENVTLHAKCGRVLARIESWAGPWDEDAHAVGEYLGNVLGQLPERERELVDHAILVRCTEGRVDNGDEWETTSDLLDRMVEIHRNHGSSPTPANVLQSEIEVMMSFAPTIAALLAESQQ